MKAWISTILCLVLSVALPSQLRAGDDPYFKGKSIALYAGFTPGGGVDSEMRLIAQYFGGFTPGAPSVVPMNMPGAGGILLANHLYAVDKADGLTLGMPGTLRLCSGGADRRSLCAL